MDRLLSTFSFEFILSQCLLEEPAVAVTTSVNGAESDSDSDDHGFGSGLVSPSDSITSSVAMSVTSEVSPNYQHLELGPASLELESPQPSTERLKHQDVLESLNSIPPSQAPVPNSSISFSQVENNLLMQIWYFGAQATHVPHNKLSRLARRVIIKIAKILRDDPASLEVVHDVVGRCHRTQAEGLLDRVLQAREDSPYHHHAPPPHSSSSSSSSRSRRGEMLSPSAGGHRGNRGRSPVRKLLTQKDDQTSPSPSQHRKNSRERDASPVPGASSSRDPLPIDSSTHKSSVDRRTDEKGVATQGGVAAAKDDKKRMSRQMSRQRSHGNASTTSGDDFVASDESFRSALSDLDLDCSSDTLLGDLPPGDNPGEELAPPLMAREEGSVAMGGEESSSSASNSHDSRKHNTSSSNSSMEKGVESEGVVSGFPNKPGYLRHVISSEPPYKGHVYCPL